MSILSLIDFLSANFPRLPCDWRGWHISPVSGGCNNRLFRVVGPEGDLAVKFTRRDARDRAGREFQALALLRSHGLDLAPCPVLLERERWPLPIVVQTWEKDQVDPEPPVNHADWRCLLEHYAAIHSVRPGGSLMKLPWAVLTFASAQAAVDAILLEMAPLLQADELYEWPWQPELRALAARLAATSFPAWPIPEFSLARCDPAINNFLHRAGQWISVDWENSGWGDPAFEIGDLLAHPNYRLLDSDLRGEILKISADLYPLDSTFMLRARVYEVVILARWVGLRARYWREYDQGLTDPSRLVQWPAEWWASLPDEFYRDLSHAQSALAEWEHS